MVVLKEKSSSGSVQGRAIGELHLRIVGTERDGQVIRLRSAKCTIGSADGCTLRLRCAGVRPVQCIILRGARGTVMRSWSAATRLNGQRFSDAMLVPGDRITIGPIALEVLASTPAKHKQWESDSDRQPAEMNGPTEFRRHEFRTHGRARHGRREAERAEQSQSGPAQTISS